MASRLQARSNFLLFVSLLSTFAGLAAASRHQNSPGETEPLAGAGELAAISATGAPVEAAVELPIPPPPLREGAAEAALSPPAEPAAAPEAASPPPADPAPAPVLAELPAPPAAPAPPPAPLQPPMPADA